MFKEKIISSLKKNLSGVANFLLPPRCPSCGDLTYHHHQLCIRCWKELTFISNPTCHLCGYPLPYAPLEQDPSHKLHCAPCLIHPPLFDRGCSSFVYKGLIRKLVLRFKHGDGTYLTPLFSKWLFTSGKKYLADCDYIIPIPLHRWRLFNRRYNQATLLARHLSRLSNIPVLLLALQRHKNTTLQGHKSRKERQKNVRNAFHLSPRSHAQIQGKTICLLDDVWTTGATLHACTKTLKEAGARHVIVLSLTRVVSES